MAQLGSRVRRFWSILRPVNGTQPGTHRVTLDGGPGIGADARRAHIRASFTRNSYPAAIRTPDDLVGASTYGVHYRIGGEQHTVRIATAVRIFIKSQKGTGRKLPGSILDGSTQSLPACCLWLTCGACPIRSPSCPKEVRSLLKSTPGGGWGTTDAACGLGDGFTSECHLYEYFSGLLTLTSQRVVHLVHDFKGLHPIVTTFFTTSSRSAGLAFASRPESPHFIRYGVPNGTVEYPSAVVIPMSFAALLLNSAPRQANEALNTNLCAFPRIQSGTDSRDYSLCNHIGDSE